MKYLFFDVETDGLPKSYNADFSDIDNYPRVVQIAWGCAENATDTHDIKSFIIKPDGFVISEENSKIHGITMERALSEGKPIETILELFEEDLFKCECIVAHNIDFDLPVVYCEMLRDGIESNILDKECFCTMKDKRIIEFCNIKMWGVYDELKWAKLIELHKKLFGVEFDGQHDAKYDVAACMKCFFELKERGII